MHSSFSVLAIKYIKILMQLFLKVLKSYAHSIYWIV